jgi:hypothetical protein
MSLLLLFRRRRREDEIAQAGGGGHGKPEKRPRVYLHPKSKKQIKVDYIEIEKAKRIFTTLKKEISKNKKKIQKAKLVSIKLDQIIVQIESLIKLGLALIPIPSNLASQKIDLTPLNDINYILRLLELENVPIPDDDDEITLLIALMD